MGFEKVFTNGTIYIDAKNKINNFAITGHSVAAHNLSSAELANAEKVVDLKGAVVFPGFNDSHNHLLETALALTGVTLFECSSSQLIADKISKYLQAHSGCDLLFGLGFTLPDMSAWSLADLAKLDEATGNAVVILVDGSGHNVILNSAAMRRFGTTTTRGASFAGIVGVQNGKPTGLLRERAMAYVFEQALPLMDKDVIKNFYLVLANQWASLGYTSTTDMMGTMGFELPPDILFELEAEGKLPLRVHYMATIATLADVEKALQYKDRNSEQVRFTGCKIFIDGAFACGQAWTTWKHLDGEYGLTYVSTSDEFGPEYNLVSIVNRADELGLNMHYHVQGDQGIDAIITALDNIIAQRGKLSSNHTLIHLAFPRADQMSKLKTYGARVNFTVQICFWIFDGGIDVYYGERKNEAVKFRDYFDSGMTFGLSSDFSVSPPPYQDARLIFEAGLHPEKHGFPEHQPLTMEQILTGYTINSAITTGWSDYGDLAVGKKADFIVLNHDLYAVPNDDYSTYIEVQQSWVSGELKFQKK